MPFKILVIDDNIRDRTDTISGLPALLEREGYEVATTADGEIAYDLVFEYKPDLIVLDIMLPDINGYEVCRQLRTNTRTSHIPVIFLTQKDERSDKLQGLELGADDYITKPFDIEELKLRVQGAIRRSERESLTDPRSGLPAGRLIEEQLRRIIRQEDWALLDLRVNYLDAFRDVYGFVAGDDVLRFAAMLLSEVVDELGSSSDFIGHAGGDNFIIITKYESVDAMRERIKKRFAEEAQTHYNFMDRIQGFIQIPRSDGGMTRVPFMTFAVGTVSPREQYFSDIREITELAAEARRLDAASQGVR